MRGVSKANVRAVLMVALLLCIGAYVAAPALAQDDVPLDDQYDLPSGYQYDPPPATTTPLAEDQYDAVPEDQPGGNTDGATTGPGEDGNDGGNDGGASEASPPDRAPSDDAARDFRRISNGFLLEALALLGVLALVTTLVFLLERNSERRRA